MRKNSNALVYNREKQLIIIYMMCGMKVVATASEGFNSNVPTNR